jgi:membrane complex biogenesis BtpA family protein
MAALIGQLRARIGRPFGVDIVWDPVASLAVARATGGSFVREAVTGVYESDLGVMRPSFGDLEADKDVKIFANITPEFTSPLGRRSRQTKDRARAAAFLGVDAILITGPVTGLPASLQDLHTVKAEVPGTPVLASTGVTADTVNQTLHIADGVIVGTHLKRDGVTWNPVDPDRAAAFMAAAAKAQEAQAENDHG